MPALSATRGLDIYHGSDPDKYARNIELFTYSGGSAGWNQKWTFEASGGYRSVAASSPPTSRPGQHQNCLGYVTFIDQDLQLLYQPPTGNKRFPQNIDEHISAVTQTVSSLVNGTCTPIAYYNSPIGANEYRIAYRPKSVGGAGYHFIIQLSDGTWAGKNDFMASKHFGNGNPSTSPEMWDNNYYPTTWGTFYFKVKRG